MGIENPFGKRTAPPPDRRIVQTKAKLNEYRDLTQAVHEHVTTLQENEQKRAILEQEMATIEKVVHTLPFDEETMTISLPTLSSLPQDVIMEFVDGSTMRVDEVRTILTTAMEVRSREARSLLASSKEVEEISDRHEVAGRRFINKERESEEE